MRKPITLKLSDDARERVIDDIEAWRMMGDKNDLKIASAMQILLDIHDQVHGIKETAQ